MLKSHPIWTKSLRGAAALGTLALTACFFGQEEEQLGKVSTSYGATCVDVPESVRHGADSLVEAANEKMINNFEFWFDGSDSWWEAKERSPEGALKDYEKALALAPGHCQAVFGRAMANASMITQDKQMDDFVRKVEALDEDGLAKRGSARSGVRPAFAGIFKAGPEEAAPALAKLSSSLRQVDRPTLEDAQALIETSIMPRLDSAISALESVLDYKLFAVRFQADGRTFEIDRGEIGPGLAGLKVAKAWLTVVAGYNLDMRLDSSYNWIDTLSGIREPDFDHLTQTQTKALRHLTGLFESGSPFTRMKPAWKDRVQGIPTLLLSAVGDAQRGLETAIEEARTPGSQEFDVWRAGSGEDADVDTTDLRGAIEALERTKKYLRGQVPVKYDHGGKTVTVDFTRLFHIDGAQKLLPRFRFLAFEQWNDTVSADTSWSSWMGDETQGEIFSGLGYGAAWEYQDKEFAEWRISVRHFGIFDTTGTSPFYSVVLSKPFSWQDTVLATLTPDSLNPCRLNYVRHYKIAGPFSSSAPDLISGDTSGVLTLEGCRDASGQAEYVSWVDAVTKGPIEFLDASGNRSLGIPDMKDIDDPLDLKGRITFEDPTFGGVFPGLTNETLWQQVSDLGKSPGDRVVRDCREIELPNGWWEYKCEYSLPTNPSDLDYFVYYLNWMDRLD